MKRLAIFGLTVGLMGNPSHLSAEPEALGAYPDDGLEQITYLTRCAGLARALMFGAVDLGHYGPYVPNEFNNKLTDFTRTLNSKAMEFFGFPPEELDVRGDGRTHLPHALIIVSGIDHTIDRAKGFYETMSQFRQKPEWDAIVIEDLQTCAVAPVK